MSWRRIENATAVPGSAGCRCPMIRLTQEREITPYVWVRPDEERWDPFPSWSPGFRQGSRWHFRGQVGAWEPALDTAVKGRCELFRMFSRMADKAMSSRAS